MHDWREKHDMNFLQIYLTIIYYADYYLHIISLSLSFIIHRDFVEYFAVSGQWQWILA